MIDKNSGVGKKLLTYYVLHIIINFFMFFLIVNIANNYELTKEGIFLTVFSIFLSTIMLAYSFSTKTWKLLDIKPKFHQKAGANILLIMSYLSSIIIYLKFIN